MGFYNAAVQLDFPGIGISSYRGDDVVSLTGPGVALSAVIMSLGIRLESPSPTISVDVRKWNQAAAELQAVSPDISVAISKTSGAHFRAAVPDIEIRFSASNIIDASLAVAMPETLAAIAKLYADGNEKTILAINPHNGAVSTFSNFNFNSFAVHMGKIYGADGSGIREIDGTRDDTEKIKAIAKFLKSDYGSLKFKRIRKLIVKGSDTGFDPTITVSSGGKRFSGKCHFSDGLGSQGVDMSGQRGTAGDTFSVNISSDSPLDIESIDAIFKKVR